MKSNDKTLNALESLRGVKPTTIGAAERRVKAEQEWSVKRFKKGLVDVVLILAIIITGCATVKAIIAIHGWNPFYVG